ncbi:hypothetical protein ASPZODRAFT_70614 [Penicilliopsis zonata CBS 506.65]|uniref:amidase n=1 Tax=Penicilliopsis zonata CBS 506.65 TaxID=1073090 RepID=A0A1L9SCX3_9EURO|nr:hypothetical protein ASPZODRAFT_70614 [Penicilliopsis zonata CBS 506.65]OJJ45060.1 hypothetical protein ASPZODRAFT_70614 [Penicilliopsis zonata CBS 506.65]
MSWKERSVAKRKEVAEKIPPAWRVDPDILIELHSTADHATDLIALNAVRKVSILSSRELDITENYTAVELVGRLARGELSAVDVTVAFSKRAAVAQQLTSCLTEVFFDRALQRAHYLDDFLRREKRPVGPLHGLPISIKDSYDIQGIQSTLGYVSFLDHPPATRNAAVVELLLKLGAVLYVKTNIPQAMMVADSDNNIFGRTLNPHRTNYTAGGSSGGEGALIALRGALIGVGTDIAGSVRIPALCCGVYGFKPSTGRIPYRGVVSHNLPGHPGIQGCAGPITTCLEDAELFITAVIGAEPWLVDATAHAVPWRSLQIFPKALRIGVLAEDPSWPLHARVKSALAQAVRQLAAAGHTLVPLSHDDAYGPGTGQRIALDFFSIDPLDTSLQYIAASGEPAIRSLRVLGLDTPKTAVQREACTIGRLAKLNVERSHYNDVWNDLVTDLELDVIIAPGAQNTAVPHDDFGLFPYTVMWNVLDYPAGVIPFSRIATVDLEQSESRSPACDSGELPHYSAFLLPWLPCALQVIAPRLQDERWLAAAKAIDAVLNRMR